MDAALRIAPPFLFSRTRAHRILERKVMVYRHLWFMFVAGFFEPIFYLLSPANVHDAPFARPLLEWAVRLYAIRPRVIRLDAAYWGLRLIAWIHATLHAVAVIPWNPKRQKNRSCLPPT